MSISSASSRPPPSREANSIEGEPGKHLVNQFFGLLHLRLLPRKQGMANKTGFPALDKAFLHTFFHDRVGGVFVPASLLGQQQATAVWPTGRRAPTAVPSPAARNRRAFAPWVFLLWSGPRGRVPALEPGPRPWTIAIVWNIDYHDSLALSTGFREFHKTYTKRSQSSASGGFSEMSTKPGQRRAARSPRDFLVEIGKL